jgi:hypothetical protein
VEEVESFAVALDKKHVITEKTRSVDRPEKNKHDLFTGERIMSSSPKKASRENHRIPTPVKSCSFVIAIHSRHLCTQNHFQSAIAIITKKETLRST